MTDRGYELFRRVGLHVGTRAFDDHRLVVGEGGFEALALLGTERDVGVTPHDQGGQVGEIGKARLDFAEESVTAEDPAGKHGAGLPPLGGGERRR